MNRSIRRKLAAEKQKIENQLARAVQLNMSGPVISGAGVRYELADKVKAISSGGIGAVQRLVRKLGLAETINSNLKLFKLHVPYYESDHVLNIAYNILCGGQTLDDIELRRNDCVFLEAIGASSIPDPTTAGDFCGRFVDNDVEQLQDAINEVRVKVWKSHPTLVSKTARIDGDGTSVVTAGQCKQGMDINYKGEWGYAPLLISLANNSEPLFIFNRSGNRPSHEGAAGYFDRAVALCRKAGFRDILLRGDTDFSLTESFDRWANDGVRFVFCYDASPLMKMWGDSAPKQMYHDLVRRAERAIATKPRTKPENVKEAIVRERGYVNIKLKSEEVVDFEYQPIKCKIKYRVVAVRKNLSREKGDLALFDEIRYFFYITNDFLMSCADVVGEAAQRCNQENLIEQLKNFVRALHAPVNTLTANWAYMVMAALAWSLKAWIALTLPISPRWKDRHTEQQRLLLRMEFRRFLGAFINVPAQILRTGRSLIYRLLAWNPWQVIFFRFVSST